MKWFYAPEYDYARNLPQHRSVYGFPLDKATQIRDRLIEAGVTTAAEIVRPEPVTEDELALVHTPELIRDLHDAYSVSRAVDFDAISLLPSDTVWQAVVAAQLHAAGGTCEALRHAAGADGPAGWATNLSGGFHHARPDLSHGFCLVNDVALAVARLARDGIEPSLWIIDLDVHQGDGNAVCFAKNERVFTFSMHERAIFPTPKAVSSLDIGLPRGIGDEDYSARLELALEELGEQPTPEIIVYVAGTDVFAGDRLSSLRLSAEGIRARDQRIGRLAAEHGCALVTLPAGGYSPQGPALSADGFAAIAALEPAGRA